MQPIPDRSQLSVDPPLDRLDAHPRRINKHHRVAVTVGIHVAAAQRVIARDEEDVGYCLR